MKQVIGYSGLDAAERPMGTAPLSAAVLHGAILFISGQVGIVPQTGRIAGPGIAVQTRQALENLKDLVTQAGLGMDDVVKVNLYLVDLSLFDQVNMIYAQYFGPPYPVRSTVGVRLNNPDLLIEIDAIAMR